MRLQKTSTRRTNRTRDPLSGQRTDKKCTFESTLSRRQKSGSYGPIPLPSSDGKHQQPLSSTSITVNERIQLKRTTRLYRINPYLNCLHLLVCGGPFSKWLDNLKYCNSQILTASSNAISISPPNSINAVTSLL